MPAFRYSATYRRWRAEAAEPHCAALIIFTLLLKHVADAREPLAVSRPRAPHFARSLISPKRGRSLQEAMRRLRCRSRYSLDFAIRALLSCREILALIDTIYYFQHATVFANTDADTDVKH
jgi:hypothetical protein